MTPDDRMTKNSTGNIDPEVFNKRPPNNMVAGLCSCVEFTDGNLIQGVYHCSVCGKPMNEQD